LLFYSDILKLLKLIRKGGKKVERYLKRGGYPVYLFPEPRTKTYKE